MENSYLGTDKGYLTVYSHLVNNEKTDIPFNEYSSVFVVLWNEETKPFLCTVNHQNNPEPMEVYNFTMGLQNSRNLHGSECFNSLDDAISGCVKHSMRWNDKHPTKENKRSN